ncbi:hypothetical protein [Kribbella sp. VKM Ac-2568]|uniref:hypothetical protein n=1 Tax=Kribbella sp. VKM Ac-2568 TaxID=2512219 RepID=UPI00104866AE|nr:hypothetical protein [Kribbella sp. VKM Ac-2568]TCM46712.1 hypothetical protein EV648_105189 [Kribbella sp. VKM Ac-2568]
MTGSHRAPRGGSRAAAREARRQQARRRNQLIGAGVAVLVLVGGGGIAAVNAFGGDGSAGEAKSSGGDDKSGGASKMLSDAKVLLDGPAAKPLSATGVWTVAGTADGSSAPDRSFVCQSQRFADPAGIRTWVRNFKNATTKDTAVQYLEVSNDAAAAGKAYTTILGWLSQCATPQYRLISSYSTTGLGDKGVVAVFGQPGEKINKYRTVSVSTAGQTTMVMEHDSTGKVAPKPYGVMGAASAGLKRICAEAECTTGTPAARVALLPTSEPAGFMAPIDLPILDSIDTPWVSAASTTRNGTGCEKIDLKKARAAKYKSQTYVAPDAKVPTEFGLDTMVAKFATPVATSTFVTGIRKNVDNCKKTTSNATVKATGTLALPSIKGESWRASYDTGGGKIFTYRIGIAATGDRAVYILYPVLKNLDISDTAFNEVLVRAAERSATFK